MQKRFATVGLFIVLAVVNSLSATLVSGGGLYVRRTGTDLGHIAPGQTLIFDLLRAYQSDAELTVINNDTNEIVAQFTEIWDFSHNIGGGFCGGTYYPSTVVSTIDDESGFQVASLTNIPEGNYRVTLEALAPDYYTTGFREDLYGFFDNYGTYGQGFVGIDMGINYDSFVGTDIILDTY